MESHTEGRGGRPAAGARDSALAVRAGRFVAACSLAATVAITAIAGTIVWLQFDTIARQRVEHLADQIRYRFDVEIGAPLLDARALAGSAILTEAMKHEEPYPAYLGVMLDEFVRRKPRMRRITLHDRAGRSRSSDASADRLAREAARSGVSRFEWIGDGVLRAAYPVVLPRLASSEGALVVEMDVDAALTPFDDMEGAVSGYQIVLHEITGQRQVWPSSAEQAPKRTYRSVARDLRIEGFGPVATIEAGIGSDAFWTPIALLAPSIGAAMLLMVFIVLKTSRTAAHRLVQPIETMIREIDRLARDPASDRLPFARSGIRELNTLADGVARMLRAVSDSRERLNALLMRRTRQLAASEGMLSGILATLDDVVFSCSPDGSMLRYASPSIRGLMDVPGSVDTLDTIWKELLASTRAPILFAPQASDKGSADTTIELRTATGRIKWVRIKSRYVPGEERAGEDDRIDGSISDMTAQVIAQRERDQAQRQLAEWAQRVDAVFMMSPDGFACLDADGVLVSLNPVMAEILDVGKFDALGWEEAHLIRRLQERTMPIGGRGVESSGVPRWPAQLELVGRRVVRIQVRDYHGPITGRVVYLHDVSREYELDRLKSEFLSIAAHELRTPMASLLGYTELLLRGRVAPEATEEVYGIVHKQAERLGRLLDDLLDLARIEACGARNFHFVACTVQEIVHEAIDALAVDEDEREVDVSMPNEALWVRADPEKLLQALLNILSNAYKYSSRESRVRLKVDAQEVDGAAPVLSLVLADEGIGMSPEDAEHAFERFFRADRSRSVPGSGLGLSLVKEIIEGHGGSVSLRSQPGHGTEVTIVLPLARAPDDAVDAVRPDAANTIRMADRPVASLHEGRS